MPEYIPRKLVETADGPVKNLTNRSLKVVADAQAATATDQASGQTIPQPDATRVVDQAQSASTPNYLIGGDAIKAPGGTATGTIVGAAPVEYAKLSTWPLWLKIAVGAGVVGAIGTTAYFVFRKRGRR